MCCLLCSVRYFSYIAIGLAAIGFSLLLVAGTAHVRAASTESTGTVSATVTGGDSATTSSEAAAAPRIGAILEDVALALDEPPAVLDLVAGLVGDVDTYQARSADAEVVTVHVVGSMLTLTPVALGETSVSVFATNEQGSAYQEFGVAVVARSAPEIVALIEERVLTLGAPPVVVDISPAFSDGVLTYAATCDDPSLVAVRVSGSRVALTGLAPGTTRIFATAEGVSGAALQAFRVQVVEARPPVGAEPLADRVLTVGDPPLVLNVSSAFSGDGLTYRATAGDGAVVRAEMSASELSLTGLSGGVTTVSVTATNPSGAAVQSLHVTVHMPENSASGRTGPARENPTG